MKKIFDKKNYFFREYRVQKTIKIFLILMCAFLLIFSATFLTGILSFKAWASAKTIDEDLLPKAKLLPTFYDCNGNVLPYGSQNYLSPEEIPDNLKNAFIAIEDKRFYSHNGYDPYRMVGAIVSNLKAGKIKEGASTITQQLIKNTHLSSERTVKRKLNEIALAAKLEEIYSKDEILSMYLSVIYFGNGAYGVKKASNVMFDKEFDSLTLGECAILAGLVKNPKKYSPITSPKECELRRNTVLDAMFSQNFITEDELLAAKAEDITKYERNITARGKSRCLDLYLNLAINEVAEALNVTKYQIENYGLQIYTNLDPKLQETLDNEMFSEDNYSDSDVSGASVVLDNLTGAVKAYSSTYPFMVSRQAGSVLKPLAVYAPALDKNIVSLATPIVDERVNFSGFSPENFNGKYYGDTTVLNGIEKSLNSVSVKVLDYLGVNTTKEYLEKMGISLSDDELNYALALGSTKNGLTPVAVAGGYSTLQGGSYKKPSFVKYVLQDGKKVYGDEKTTVNVFSPSSSSLITCALRETAKEGTAKTLSTLPFDVAAKTGTVERKNGVNSDAWCASYNDNFTVVVWHGTDKEMNERGGGYPAHHLKRIWNKIDGISQQPKSLNLSDVVKIDVDEYTTSKRREVTAASENTPLEYRKPYYFSLSNLPNAKPTKFDGVEIPYFDSRVENGKIVFTFDTEKIYYYEVIKNDGYRTEFLYSSVGSDETQNVSDDYGSLWAPTQYILRCSVLGNDGVYAVKTKTIYPSLG